MFGLPQENAGMTQLLTYAPGTTYSAHTDCNAQSGEYARAATALVYLNDAIRKQSACTA